MLDAIKVETGGINMDIDKKVEQNFANAVSEKTCPNPPSKTKYFEAHKRKIALPPSDAKFPKYKCSLPNF